MRKSFKDSLKALEADIQLANTLASVYPKEYDGACLQMRLSYSPAAQFFLFLVQWTNCHLAGALGLRRVLIYKAFEDGKVSMSIHERKASLREFYGVIFPSLLQLQRGITDVEDRKQKEICSKYKKKDEMNKGKLSEIDLEREEECGICMEINSKIVLPNCNHSMCMKCYRDWRTRSQSCPICRDSLKRVKSGDLWIYTSSNEIADLNSITRENLKRLFIYIDKLPPLITPYRETYLESNCEKKSRKGSIFDKMRTNTSLGLSLGQDKSSNWQNLISSDRRLSWPVSWPRGIIWADNLAERYSQRSPTAMTIDGLIQRSVGVVTFRPYLIPIDF